MTLFLYHICVCVYIVYLSSAIANITSNVSANLYMHGILLTEGPDTPKNLGNK